MPLYKLTKVTKFLKDPLLSIARRRLSTARLLIRSKVCLCQIPVQCQSTHTKMDQKLYIDQFSQWGWVSQSWSVWLGKGRFLQGILPTLRQWRDFKPAEQHFLLLVFKQGMAFCRPVLCPDTFLPKFQSLEALKIILFEGRLIHLLSWS